MKAFLQGLCIILPLVVSLQLAAQSQTGFIDSIHNMLVDLDDQIQYAPINGLLQKATPFSTGTEMNDSLSMYLRLLLSSQYLFQAGLLQPVSYHLLLKYEHLIERVVDSISAKDADLQAENRLWMAVTQMALTSTATDPHLARAKIILLQLQADTLGFLPRTAALLARIYDVTGNYDSAYYLYRQSLLNNPNVTREEKILYDSCLFFLGDYCRLRNKADTAVLLFQQLLKQSRELYGENSEAYVFDMLRVADMFSYMAKYETALALNFKALPIIKRTCGEASNQYAISLMMIGEIYYSMGEYSKALPYTKNALALKEKLFGKTYFDNVVNLHDLSMLYKQMGLYTEAIPLINESLLIAKKYFGEGIVYANDLQNLAGLYEALGQYDKALPLYQQTLSIQARLGKINFYYPRTLHSLACLYTLLGQYDKAIVLFKETLELKKAFFGTINPEYTKTLTAYAEACVLKADYKKALSVQEQSIALDKALFGDIHPNIAKGYHVLASIYFAKGEMEKAETASTTALQLQYKLFDSCNAGVADSYDMLGNISKAKHKPAEALNYYTKAFNIRDSLFANVHPGYIKSLYNIGLMQIQLQKIDAGAHLLMMADSLALVHIAQSYACLSEKEKLVYLHTNEKQFQYLPSLLYLQKIKSNDVANRVYNHQLALKATILFYQQQVYNSIRNCNDSAALELYTNWHFNKALLGQQVLLPPLKRLHDFDSLQDVTMRMEEQLSAVSARFRTNALPVTVSDIRNHLGLQEAAIEFIKFRVYDNRWTDRVAYAALVLLPGEMNAHFIPLFEERELKEILQFINNSDAAINFLYTSNAAKTKAGKSLYDLIWKPLSPLLDSVHTVYYAPCGLLYRISFDAIQHKGTCLNEHYLLKQMLCTRNIIAAIKETGFSSASIWGDIAYDYPPAIADEHQKQTTAPGNNMHGASQMNALSIGFAWKGLPDSKIEMENVAAILQQKNISCSILSQAAASEDQFKQMSAQAPELIHIATHAFFFTATAGSPSNNFMQPDNVLSLQEDALFRTGLAMAGANNAGRNIETGSSKEDHILTAYEISQLDLGNTKLVALSACETGLGDIEDNEGVFGLQRAFTMAGAKQVLMSLWKIPDKETAEFMQLFYEGLVQCNNAGIALRNAQLVMKKKYPPYYWAAFVLTQ